MHQINENIKSLKRSQNPLIVVYGTGPDKKMINPVFGRYRLDFILSGPVLRQKNHEFVRFGTLPVSPIPYMSCKYGRNLFDVVLYFLLPLWCTVGHT